MQAYPHHYIVRAVAPVDGIVHVSSDGLETLPSQAPAEFGGPGDLWSPETFLVAAVANCLILTFRAIARASKFEYNSISCQAEGVLDRVDRVTQFTAFHLQVTLHVPLGTDVDKAEHLVEKSDHVCLVSNSLTASTILEQTIIVDEQSLTACVNKILAAPCITSLFPGVELYPDDKAIGYKAGGLRGAFVVTRSIE